MPLGPARPGPLTFTLEGAPYTLVIPADGLEVCEWARVGNWYALVPGCLDQDSSERFYGLLGDPYGPVGLRACARLVHRLARAVYGQEWHVAGRLAATAEQHWELFSAWTVTVSFDPEAASAHRLCSAVYSWLRSGCQEEKDVRKLEAQLYAPPPLALRRGNKAVLPGFSKDDQAAAWQQALATLGPGG
ncbi:hypothetical protein ACFPC0_11115 [Streptomyces andamanensis]|uniref:Uncharacterized protein n=1 Tax=Streptomyces andamanensis TaxID=1565035 RepID=A0ABV8TCP3_9ACTN